jgi:hypothetical protein
MLNVSKRLQSLGLTKTEALQILNLGIGLDRTQLTTTAIQAPSDQPPVQEETDVELIDGEGNPPASPPDPSNDSTLELSDGYHRSLLSCIIEDFEERFDGEEGEAKVEEILTVLNENIELAS